MTAVVPDPGTPSVNIGTNDPMADAVAAASGATRPRMSPLPNLAFGSLASMMRFSCEYATAAATLAPAPGSTPTPKPTKALRTTLHHVKANSFRLNSLRPLGLTSTLCPRTTFSSISSISLTANSAITTTTKSMPSARCTDSKV
ncbi:hypothetical protein D3C73_1066140 [compost metagenome]